MTSAFDFEADTLGGERFPLRRLAGSVLLVVNTASRCGLTPQYAGLQRLHERFHGSGLEVLGFPCNQFGAQEPGDAPGIGEFCERNYGVAFRMFGKIAVNGPGAHPLWAWLAAEAPGVLGTRRIKWNFTKFLVRRDGSAFRRYAPRTPPEALAGDIGSLLAQARPGRS